MWEEGSRPYPYMFSNSKSCRHLEWERVVVKSTTPEISKELVMAEISLGLGTFVNMRPHIIHGFSKLKSTPYEKFEDLNITVIRTAETSAGVVFLEKFRAGNQRCGYNESVAADDTLTVETLWI